MLLIYSERRDDAADEHVFSDHAYVSTAAKMNACAELARKEPESLFICWFFRQRGDWI